MKKVFFILLAICWMVSSAIYFYLNPINNRNKEYIIVNNKDGELDYFFNEDPYFFPSIPAGVETTPFEEFSNSSSIINQYPYYLLSIFGDHTIQYNDGTNKEMTFPLTGKYDSGENYVVNEVFCELVTNKENFDYAHYKYDSDVVIREFECDSGIYISKTFFDNMNVDEDATHLKIKLPISVPVICEVEDSIEEGFEYQRYKKVIYETVMIEVEVQGIIDAKDQNVKFCVSNSIVLPYDVAKEIVDQIDYNQYTLQENQTYWKPNTYIIEVDKDVENKELGQEIYDYYGSVVFEIYDYGIESDGLKYAHDGIDLNTWPNVE